MSSLGGVSGTRGTTPVDGPPPAETVAPATAAASTYEAALAEARAADWTGCGIDPVRYTEERLSRDLFLAPLLASPTAKVVVHRDALKIGEVRSIDGSRTRNVTHPDAKDYPGRVYFSPQDGNYHLVGLAGEDWQRQTLHMLATAGVPAAKVQVAGVFDPEAICARDLDATLAAHDFDSVTVGTMGELTKAMERVLKERERPAHVERVLGEMASFLETKAREARPDRRAAWEEAARRVAAERARGGTATEVLARIEADPALRGRLGEQIRRAHDGPSAKELPWRWETKNADVLAHRIVEVDGKKHLLLHIGGAHGDMAYHAVRHILSKEATLGRVNMYGSCGSFSERLPPDTLVVPRDTWRSIEHDRGPITQPNAATLAGTVAVTNGNGSTLLREHRAGLARLRGLPAETVDMESYHVAHAVAEAGRRVELRTILRVSDVATSSELGAHREDREGTSDYDGRMDNEERVVVAFGWIEG